MTETHSRRNSLSLDEISLRELTRADDASMLRILRMCPMVTPQLSICFDRAPSMFACTELHFQRYRYGGFFRGGELLGLALFGFDEVYVNGTPRQVFSLTDAYLDPRIRGAKPILRQPAFFLAGADGELGYALILKGNRAAEKSLLHNYEGVPHRLYARLVAEQDTRTILIMAAKRGSKRYRVRHATHADIDAIVGLLDNEFRTRLFGPICTRSRFLQQLDERPDYGIQNYFVAELGREIVGVLSVWDTTSFKQNRVLRYGFGLKVTRFFHGIGATLFGFERMPREGEVFRDLTTSEYAIRDRDPEILEALLREAYNYARHGKYHSLSFGSSIDDPLLQATDPFRTERVRAHIALLSQDPTFLEEGKVTVRLPYVNVALL